MNAIAVDEGSQDVIEPQPQAKNGDSPDEGGHPARAAAPRDGSKLALVIELLRRADGAHHRRFDPGYGMAAAHDAGGAHRAAQTRICRDPRTDRRWRFSLPDLERPCSQGRSYRTAGRRDGCPRPRSGRRRKRRSRHDRRARQLRRAAKLPVAATPGASLPLDASILSIVANLEGLDLNGLRRQWRAHLGGETPAHLPRWLLMKVLAYRLQADAFGGLDKSVRRILAPRRMMTLPPLSTGARLRTRDGVGLKAGVLLVREWKGQLERVMILDEGFAWNGQTFGSLSQIAKAMTGTTWNGHRFFGLRLGKTPPADVGTDRRKSRNGTAVCRVNGASAGDASP